PGPRDQHLGLGGLRRQRFVEAVSHRSYPGHFRQRGHAVVVRNENSDRHTPMVADFISPAYRRFTPDALGWTIVRRAAPRRSWPMTVVACAALGLAGCAEFDDSTAATDWHAAPELTAEAGPQPQLPEAGPNVIPDPPSTSTTPMRPPEGCTDFDKAVI